LLDKTLNTENEIGFGTKDFPHGTSEFEKLYALHNIAGCRTDIGSKIYQFYGDSYRSIKIDSNAILLRLFGLFGCAAPRWLRRVSWSHVIRLTYTSATGDLEDLEDMEELNSPRPYRKVFKTRVEVLMPLLSFQIQLLRCPWSITSYSLVHCQSEIFTFCLEGNLEAVQLLVNKSRVSPLVVNQHGENLLHVSAPYTILSDS
jgi:hypothetical protein